MRFLLLKPFLHNDLYIDNNFVLTSCKMTIYFYKLSYITIYSATFCILKSQIICIL